MVLDYPSYRVYVGPLSSTTTESDINKIFRQYGGIEEIELKRGFAVVEFINSRDAEEAINDLDGTRLFGQRIKVEITRISQIQPRKRHLKVPLRTNYRLLIRNLTTQINWKKLKKIMSEAGEVTYANAHNRCRNQGVVEFACYSDMKNALEKLDNLKLNGRRIKLYEDHIAKYKRTKAIDRFGRDRRSRSHSRSSKRGKRTPSSPERSRSRSKDRKRSRSRSYNKFNSRGARTPSSDDESIKKESRSRSRSTEDKKIPPV
ncbi:unnamed protein product [Brassicogethes aeneus]|uniref:RRM domain-containing protein n=1 Tax=Brassicogethes aeneus TaxID=1431903 RepID=A0A9P0B101_BRAAE|nr:unnamed protein product [Brassicogethes aeneus]